MNSLISINHLIKIINNYIDYKLIFEEELIYKTEDISLELNRYHFYNRYKHGLIFNSFYKGMPYVIWGSYLYKHSKFNNDRWYLE